MLKIIGLMALLLASGCALSTDVIDVSYGKPDGGIAVPGAETAPVAVVATDARSGQRNRVSVKKNGYGMEMAAILASNDVVEETRRAIAEELRLRGFPAGTGGARLDVQVVKFYNDFKMGLFTATAQAEIILNVTVADATGRVMLTKLVAAEGIEPDVMLASGSNAQAALVDAMHKVIRKVVDDRDILVALLAARPLAPRPAS